ncbi:MSMEG_0565 family glycosyltransferase [Pseudonocardia artemisiae]
MHTLSLAEALHRQGVDVHLVAVGDPAAGLFRPTDVPYTVLPAPSKVGTTLDDRVFAAIDTLEAGLAGMAGRFDVLHAQDCIAARAAARVRDAGAPVTVVRTVHHVDDFTTQALIDCQRAAIVEPDRVLVVSEQWRGILRDEYGRGTDVVPNGVDVDRFPAPSQDYRDALRDRIGAGPDAANGKFVFLAVGGVEPRKGTVHAFRALAQLKRERGPRAVLAIVGGHSFQDYTAYREAALASLPELGLTLGEDVVLLGTVDETELAGWYHAADALSFPSVKEGWGLVVLEAMGAGLPVIASDLPVFGEYLVDGESALLPAVGDPDALAAAMRTMIDDPALRQRLSAAGRAVLPRFTWEASARRHQQIYAQVRARAAA